MGEDAAMMQLNLRAKVGQRSIVTSNIKGGIATLGKGDVCLVCHVQGSSYRCPNCFIIYCSSGCYLKHNHECTEMFAKSRIAPILQLEKLAEQDEMEKSTPATDQDIHHADDIIDEDDVGIQSIFVKLENNNNEVSCLSEEELEALYNAKCTGNKRLADITARNTIPWIPWWNDINNDDTQSKIQAMNTVRNNIIDEVERTLTGRAPSALSYQVLGLVIGYVIAIRKVNGNVLDEDLPELLWSYSPITDRNFKPLSIVQAVSTWISHHKHRENLSRSEIRSILLDCSKILGSYEMLLHTLFSYWLLFYKRADAEQILCNTHADSTVIAGLITEYIPVFDAKPAEKSELKECALYTRKCFYLLLYSFLRAREREGTDTLLVQLNEYILSCL